MVRARTSPPSLGRGHSQAPSGPGSAKGGLPPSPSYIQERHPAGGTRAPPRPPALALRSAASGPPARGPPRLARRTGRQRRQQQHGLREHPGLWRPRLRGGARGARSAPVGPVGGHQPRALRSDGPAEGRSRADDRAGRGPVLVMGSAGPAGRPCGAGTGTRTHCTSSQGAGGNGTYSAAAGRPRRLRTRPGP